MMMVHPLELRTQYYSVVVPMISDAADQKEKKQREILVPELTQSLDPLFRYLVLLVMVMAKK